MPFPRSVLFFSVRHNFIVWPYLLQNVENEVKSGFHLGLFVSWIALICRRFQFLLIPFRVFPMFMKRESVVPNEVSELDGCRPNIAAKITILALLFKISVRNASYVLFGSSMNAC